jgi:hypothetical protein
MADLCPENDEPTAVDDVRRVREEIAREHSGDMRAHMKETNRVFDQLRAKLRLKLIDPPTDSRRRGKAAE